MAKQKKLNKRIKVKKASSGGFSQFLSLFTSRGISTNTLAQSGRMKKMTPQELEAYRKSHSTWQRNYMDGNVEDTRNLTTIELANKVPLATFNDDVEELNVDESAMDVVAKKMAAANAKDTRPRLLKMVSPEQTDMWRQMGASDADLMAWQKRRIQNAAIFGLLGIALKLVIHGLTLPLLLLIVAVIGFICYWYIGYSVKSKYSVYSFNRQMQFNKFISLLTPYLNSLGGGQSLYRIFESIVPRLDDAIDQQLLQRLMLEMQQYPGSSLPYVRFARAFSTDPFSVLYMRAVANMSQHGGNPDVIQGLSKTANDSLAEKVIAIRELKVRRFGKYTSFMTMTAMTLLLCELTAVILQAVSGIHF